MSELTISEMVEQVPQGEGRTFMRSISDAGEERYFRVWQDNDYDRDCLKWGQDLPLVDSPWFGTRSKARISVSALVPLDVRFDGPADEVVDFNSTGSHAFFVSDKLFRVIEAMDPGSLDHAEFELLAKDGALPFHAVMPQRVLEAIDPRRTTVRVEDENLAGEYLRKVRCPEGIVFDNDVLQGVASFSDLDAPGWYWSKELLAEAKSQNIRGLYAKSVASVEHREFARL